MIMSTSRIEIPLTLPPPHFDDEATIATARKVVPIKGSGRTERRRKALALFSLLIASTLCGALGAIAVNYFERRRDSAVSVTQPQPPSNVSTQAKTEPSPVTVAPEVNAEAPGIQASLQEENAAVISTDERPTKGEESKTAKRENIERKSAPLAPVKREPTPDAAKLVRKRRVLPTDSEIPIRRNRRTEAGRIEYLFTGPNP